MVVHFVDSAEVYAFGFVIWDFESIFHSPLWYLDKLLDFSFYGCVRILLTILIFFFKESSVGNPKYMSSWQKLQPVSEYLSRVANAFSPYLRLVDFYKKDLLQLSGKFINKNNDPFLSCNEWGNHQHKWSIDFWRETDCYLINFNYE